jgi:hypothetical protein
MEHTPSVTEVVSSRMWHPDPGRLQAEKGTAKAVRAQVSEAVLVRVKTLKAQTPFHSSPVSLLPIYSEDKGLLCSRS